LVLKEKYPDDYKNITFIFNDVDTVPFHKMFDYQTTMGVVKHYYGFEYALGGIVVVKGADFERINGYPNFWGWGNEDKVLQTRCERHGIVIDRTQFYKIGSPEILQLFDGVARLVAPRDFHVGNNDRGFDGVYTIDRLTYSIDKDSLNPQDNKYTVDSSKINIINILSFLTPSSYDRNEYYHYDLRDSTSKVVNPDGAPTTKRTITSNEWHNLQPSRTYKKQHSQYQPNLYQQQQHLQQNIRYNHTAPPNRNIVHPPNVHVFSPDYAKYLGVKPNATSSAHIRLGGVRK
jgi:N-terminal domain of galactosyltransferase